jgi:hypothetical protein
MAKRYIGSATITITYHDDDSYKGTVSANGTVWKFDDLHAPHIGFNFASDSSEAYDRMACAAVSFAAHYDGEFGAIENAITWAAMENGAYAVRRAPQRKYVNAKACACGGPIPLDRSLCGECDYDARNDR